MSPLRLLASRFAPYPWPLLRGLSCIVMNVAMGLISPILVGQAVDGLRLDVTSGALLFYAGLVVGVALVQGVFNYLQRNILVSLSRDIEFDLRNDYFRHLERLSPSYYQKSYTGDLMARATNDVLAVRMVCGPAIMYTANTVLIAAGAIFWMLRIHAGLSLVALSLMPLVAAATKFFGQRIHVLFERVQEQFSRLSTKVQENLAGVRVVRAYTQEGAEQEDFARLNREYVERSRRLIRWTAAFRPALQMLIGLGIVIVLWYGGGLALSGRITVGQFVTFNLFLVKLTWPMISLGWVINIVERGTASLKRVYEVLDEEPSVVEEPPLVRPAALAGAVRVKDLTFTYPGAASPVLRQIDFEVAAGETVAIVGRTGAGKSTLLSLLPRLYNPPPGTLFLDGVDVRRLPLSTLRSAIAMVPQETFLFSTTLLENILMGSPAATRAQVDEAIRMAGLEEDLAGLPNGVDTVVGERGLTLSGGQKQRVALARALVSQAPVLLLDDSLSAVDTHTEEQILNHLKAVFARRSVWLVSHRVSTVQGANLILVLDDGQIVERGTHSQLIALGGLYAELYERQLLEEELAAV